MAMGNRHLRESVRVLTREEGRYFQNGVHHEPDNKLLFPHGSDEIHTVAQQIHVSLNICAFSKTMLRKTKILVVFFYRLV